MSTKIDQKAYLQKYLSGTSGEKKKKKKKVTKGKGFKIIDDDIDLSKLRPLDGDELDILGEGEDAPQIAGIIDERPEEVRKMEQFKTTSKWRVISEDDGFNSKLKIHEIKKDIKEVEKDNELIFGKMYSDSEDEKNNSDLSPPRKNSSSKTKEPSRKPQKNNDSDCSPQRGQKPARKPQENSNSDCSPPRRRDKNYDSDLSPPRQKENQKSKERKKPSRWGNVDRSPESPKRSKNDSSHKDKGSGSPSRKSRRDSDASPPRKNRKDSDSSPPRRNRKNSDASPPRRSRNDTDDFSRKTKRDTEVPQPRKRRDSDASPPRKSRKDSDASPPRKRKNEPTTSKKSQKSPPRRNNSPSKRPRNSPQHNISPDLSPPRKRKSQERNTYNNKHKTGNKYDQRNSPDSDLSPPRKNRKSNSPRKRKDSSDLSPPRKERKERFRKNSDSPPPTNKKMARTLEGKMARNSENKMARTLEGKIAGLQDAKQLREENEAFRRREEEAFRKMGDEVSGRNAQVVSRKGKRETSEERNKQIEKAARQKELDEKYKKWSKGLKQLQDEQARMQDFIHEASKPLARHRDDKDLENRLKDIEREGDPMLQYIREKKRERGELPPEKPTYKGNFPPNRFNIRPGYRWDGVDRSNGYEKKYFEQHSKRKAQEEEAYKWSTEDL